MRPVHPSRQEAELDEKIQFLQEEKQRIRSQRKLTCPRCHKGTQIKNIDLYDRQYYVSPYSCTGGDYWTHDEYGYVCPKCKTYIRVHHYCDDYAFVEKYKWNFKSYHQAFKDDITGKMFYYMHNDRDDQRVYIE